MKPLNIFLTGPPSSGKTTIIKKIVAQLIKPAKGFYTQEIRTDGKRQGFKMITLDGKEGLLAHRNKELLSRNREEYRIRDHPKEFAASSGEFNPMCGLRSEYNVSGYGVSIENIEQIAVPAIIPDNEDQIIILDEIGKMECFSIKFKEFSQKVLDSSNIVIGTITIGGTEFIREVKERNDIKTIEVTENNRNRLPEEILKLVQ